MPLERLYHRICKFLSPRFSSDIFRQLVAISIHLFQGIAYFQRGVWLSNVPQHQQG